MSKNCIIFVGFCQFCLLLTNIMLYARIESVINNYKFLFGFNHFKY